VSAAGGHWTPGAQRSIRRECVDHIVVLGEAHLRRILKTYAGYYNKSEHTGRWTKMHRRFVPFSGSGTSRHTRSSVGFITITYGFRFSVQTEVALEIFTTNGSLSVDRQAVVITNSL
jgi:hypothetical protein